MGTIVVITEEERAEHHLRIHSIRNVIKKADADKEEGLVTGSFAKKVKAVAHNKEQQYMKENCLIVILGNLYKEVEDEQKT